MEDKGTSSDSFYIIDFGFFLTTVRRHWRNLAEEWDTLFVFYNKINLADLWKMQHEQLGATAVEQTRVAWTWVVMSGWGEIKGYEHVLEVESVGPGDRLGEGWRKGRSQGCFLDLHPKQGIFFTEMEDWKRNIFEKND